MITRFAVKGFKNLQNVNLPLGPVTCLAGLNGVGKSNFFDALMFLKQLADLSFMDAASQVRGGNEVRNLFTSGGDCDYRMELSADLLIPRQGKDEFNQVAEASSTFVTYTVALRLVESAGHDRIQLDRETLTYISKGDASRRLNFPHSKPWLDSVLFTERRAQFISTDPEAGIVKLHQDRPRRDSTKRGGRTWQFPLADLPRTVLSSARNSQESPTDVLVRAALRRCRLLQLEPSALRRPDDFSADSHLASDGSHLPATLYRLQDLPDLDVISMVSNRLAQLVQEVRSVRVHRDPGLRRLTLYLNDRKGTELPAVSLSDGTLRFLALTVLEMDPEETGVICLEEPENGVHPERLESILRLLRDIGVDPNMPVGDDNPLRQILLSSHSPTVAELMDPNDLVFAQSSASGLRFAAIENTWRALRSIPRGSVLNYLRPARRANGGKETVGGLYEEQLLLPFAE